MIGHVYWAVLVAVLVVQFVCENRYGWLVAPGLCESMLVRSSAVLHRENGRPVLPGRPVPTDGLA